MVAYELDAIRVRLAELEGVVGVHHAVQGALTFRGVPHGPLELPGQVVSEVVDFPDRFVFEGGADVPAEKLPWCREVFLRDASLTEAVHIDPEALFMVCDGDEIPHPDAVRQAVGEYDTVGPRTLVTDYRQWWADWRAPDVLQYPYPLVHHAVIGKFDDYVGVGGAHMARSAIVGWPPCDATGWHLSSLGDTAFMHQKLEMFAHSELDNPQVRDLQRLEQCRRERRDFLDRFRLEETADLPATIHRFPHLLSAPRGE